MNIKHLTVSNFLRIRAVDIVPAGHVVRLRGRNCQGKSSILWAIRAALGGKREHPENPIHDGADEATVHLDLGDYLVDVVWRRDKDGVVGATLTLRAPNGARYNEPQKRLSSFIGAVSFDPLAFASMDAKAQVEVLRGLVGTGIDEIDARRAKAFATRTDVNRDLERLFARLVPDQGAGVPDVPVSVVALLERMEQVNAQRSAAEDLSRAVKQAQDAHAALIARRDAAREALKKLDAECLASRENMVAEQGRLFALPPTPDPEPLRKQIAEADMVNARVQAKKLRAEQALEIEALAKQAAALTTEVANCDDAKRLAIASAKLPVPGLSFDERGVTFNEHPFSQASDAERLRVSVALGAALNPNLRALLVRQGSLLDDDGWRLLGELAEQMDAQVWIEDVGKEGPGIVIEDGEVLEVHGDPQTPGAGFGLSAAGMVLHPAVAEHLRKQGVHTENASIAQPIPTEAEAQAAEDSLLDEDFDQNDGGNHG